MLNTHSHYCFLIITGSGLKGACLNNCRPITTVGEKNKCFKNSDDSVFDSSPMRVEIQFRPMTEVDQTHSNLPSSLSSNNNANFSRLYRSIRCEHDLDLMPRIHQALVGGPRISYKQSCTKSIASHKGDPGSILGRVTPDIRTWESCRTMSLVGGFSGGFPVSPALSFRRCSILTSITLIGSQNLDVKNIPNLFTHSRATVAKRLACSPPTKANRVQSLGRTTTGISLLGIVPDDAAGRRVFSGVSRFPRPFILALLHTHLSPSSALQTSLLRAAQISSLSSRYYGRACEHHGYVKGLHQSSLSLLYMVATRPVKSSQAVVLPFRSLLSSVIIYLSTCRNSLPSCVHPSLRCLFTGCCLRDWLVLLHTLQYGSRYLFPCQSATGSESSRGVSNELCSNRKGDFDPPRNFVSVRLPALWSRRRGGRPEKCVTTANPRRDGLRGCFVRAPREIVRATAPPCPPPPYFILFAVLGRGSPPARTSNPPGLTAAWRGASNTLLSRTQAPVNSVMENEQLRQVRSELDIPTTAGTSALLVSCAPTHHLPIGQQDDGHAHCALQRSLLDGHQTLGRRVGALFSYTTALAHSRSSPPHTHAHTHTHSLQSLTSSLVDGSPFAELRQMVISDCQPSGCSSIYSGRCSDPEHSSHVELHRRRRSTRNVMRWPAAADYSIRVIRGRAGAVTPVQASCQSFPARPARKWRPGQRESPPTAPRLAAERSLRHILVQQNAMVIQPHRWLNEKKKEVCFPDEFVTIDAATLPLFIRLPHFCYGLLASHQGDPGSIPSGVTPDFRKWESCRTMVLVGEFSQGSSVSPALGFRRCSIPTSITLFDSQDLAVKNRPNLLRPSSVLSAANAVERALCGSRAADVWCTAALDASIGAGVDLTSRGDAENEVTSATSDASPPPPPPPTARPFLVVLTISIRTIHNDANYGRGRVVVRLLASRLGEPGSIPVWVAPQSSNVRIVPDDAAGRWGFLGDLQFPAALAFRRCYILTSFHPHRLSRPQGKTVKPCDPAHASHKQAVPGIDVHTEADDRGAQDQPK
ncbi:hypothetical protein PR048_030036 [Dryococelus australis]|uniref:Uncharacterized protein n=1 Tax=Dryococelus australis TaxID=614101 RepID=A0ABQ9G7T9_9NEOP|nr:hypothetical protein PR048_030036 [Dryococelus australis]